MIKQILISTALITCLFFTSEAQTDTSSYDLGRISVNKNFTQGITIKGSDLERYQFSDLADAINVWLYGTYSNSSTLVYVINGNIINDVNTYSIYDIDEITLVQNAMAQVSGAGPGQQMVLIKLKTNRPGKQGVEAAGQTSLVNMANQNNASNVKSTTNIYDQYYLSGYRNFDATNVGLSVDYQHDVLPALTNAEYSDVDPMHFNRFKLNGYANAKLWTGTTVNFGINYVPQQNRFGDNYNPASYEAGESDNIAVKGGIVQHFVSSNISINSHIVKGLTNTLAAAYAHYNYFEGDSVNSVFISPGNPNQNTHSLIGADDKESNLLLRDNLAYHAKLGVFDIEPSLNFSYRKFEGSNRDSTATIQYYGSLSGGIPVYELSEQSEASNIKLYLLTPSVNIAYKDIFNLQGGFVSLLNSGKDYNANYPLSRIFPFLSASVDIFKLSGLSNMSLKAFGSFSRQNELLDDPSSALDGFGLQGSLSQGIASLYSGSGNLPTLPSADINPLKALNNYQAGLVLGLFKNISISYDYQEGYGSDLVAVVVPYGPNLSALDYLYYYSKEITNRIGINYNFNADDFLWRTVLNIAQEKLEIADPNVNASYYSAYLDNGHRYSGGFTNRFSYKTLFAGLDILYQLGERPITLENAIPGDLLAPPHINAFSLQNLYFGSQIKINHIKYAEVFANGRNILQNNSSNITDNRRFYGVGFKEGL